MFLEFTAALAATATPQQPTAPTSPPAQQQSQTTAAEPMAPQPSGGNDMRDVLKKRLANRQRHVFDSADYELDKIQRARLSPPCPWPTA